MSDKLYIINKTKSIIIVQDNQFNSICTLRPYTASIEAYNVSEIKTCAHVQNLLASGAIELSETNEVEVNEFGKDYGQTYSIGTTAQLKGDNNIAIKILAYSPSTKKYKVRIVKNGGILVVSEKEIIPAVAEENNFQQEVEVVDNEGAMEDEVEAMNADDAIRMYEAAANQAPKEAEVVFNDKEMQEDEFGEEQLIIKKEGAKFAEEVSINRVAKDTSKEVTKKLASVLKKPEVKSEEKHEVDLNKIPEKHQEWFSNFLAKDDRKKKMAISACNDVEKLMLIIQNCDELTVKLATTKLQKLNK